MQRPDDPLPAFVSAATLAQAMAAATRPPKRISVSEAAEKHRRLSNPGGGYSGPWRNEFAPYLTEPMDRALARDVDTLVLVGPAQFGKTEVFLNVLAHAIKYRPADALMLQPTRELAQDFAERRLENKCLRCSPDLAAEIGDDRGDDKVMTKTFRNGMMISVIWPVSSQVASRPVPTILIDERDSIADDLAGEGDPVDLLKKRSSTFGRNALCIVASSPKRASYSGIMPLYDVGDRRLWHVPCPHCAAYFAPGFDAQRKPTLSHLFVRDDATPDQAREEAHLVCPHCAARIDERDKLALNARGVWLAVGETISAAGEIGGHAIASRTASYWLSGLSVRTKPWGDIAAELVTARQTLEQRQEEASLKTFWNTTLGAPYRSVRLGDAAIDPEQLRERAEDVPLLRLPPWAGFITAAVDVQATRFAIQLVAWGPDGRAAPIAYFDLFKTIDGSGDERILEPARRAEDWDLLVDAVIARPIPRSDGASEVLPVRTAIDTGGEAGVTGQAYEFWMRLRERDPALARATMLVKGTGRREAPPLSIRRIEVARKGTMMRTGLALTLVNVEALKDMVGARLRRERRSPGHVQISRHLPDRWFEEITAEVKTPDGWQLQPGRRNEALDTFVYALAAWMRLGAHRIDWTNPPYWARPAEAASAAEASTAPVLPSRPVAPAYRAFRRRIRF